MTQSFTLPCEARPRDFRARMGRRARSIGASRRRRHGGRRAAVLLAAVAVPAMAAPETWTSFEIGDAAHAQAAHAQAGGAQAGVRPMPFEQRGASFPGSAFYYLAAEEPQAAGRPLDPGAHWDSEDARPLVGTPAAPMRIDNSGVDRSRALHCMTAAIYYEAASEADDGQRAVAQVVLNRVAHPAYPSTVCGVVFQGSERTTGCQFSFTCDGSLARVPSRMFWQRAEAVARAALSGHVHAAVGLATHYHTIAVHPYWAPKLSYLGTIGAHRFYKFGGAAGRIGAFRFAYAGGEPAAAPHPRDASATGADRALDPLLIQRAFDSGLKAAQAANGPVTPGPSGLTPVKAAPAPAYSAELQQRGGEALYRGQSLPQATGIRPEYRNSGQWIVQPGS